MGGAAKNIIILLLQFCMIVFLTNFIFDALLLKNNFNFVRIEFKECIINTRVISYTIGSIFI